MYKISEKVRLIAAAPDMIDSNFKNSLILVIENMHEGAFGFIVNKPSDIMLNEIYSESHSICTSDLNAWEGGPVDEDRGFLMTHSSLLRQLGLDQMAEEEEAISFSDNVVVLSDTDFVKEFFTQYVDNVENYMPGHRRITGATSGRKRKNQPFKFLLGYAGWDIDQLDDEIAEGLWIEVPFEERLVFNTPPEKAWKEALAKVGLVNVDSYIVPDSDWLN